MQAFLQDIAAVTWDRMNSFHSLEKAWSFFKNSFSLIMNKHAPLKTFRIKNRYSPCFSNDLTELIHHKNALWRKARSTQSPVDWLAFRQCRNKTTQAIRNAKSSHFKEKLTTCGTNESTFLENS